MTHELVVPRVRMWRWTSRKCRTPKATEWSTPIPLWQGEGVAWTICLLLNGDSRLDSVVGYEGVSAAASQREVEGGSVGCKGVQQSVALNHGESWD